MTAALTTPGMPGIQPGLALKAMLKENGPVPAAPFDGFEVLLPARDYKNRHASILLAVEAAAEAAAAAQASKTA